MSEIAALYALRDLAKTASVPAADAIAAGVVLEGGVEALTIAAAYVWPAQHAAIPQSFNLPTMMVMKQRGVRNPWMRQSHGGNSVHAWNAEIVLLLAQGPLTRFDSDSAAAEAMTFNWAEALARVLLPNLTLKQTAARIGSYGGRERPEFFYTTEGHVYWGQETFWGIYWEIPIEQVVTLTIGNRGS